MNPFPQIDLPEQDICFEVIKKLFVFLEKEIPPTKYTNQNIALNVLMGTVFLIGDEMCEGKEMQQKFIDNITAQLKASFDQLGRK